jgi:hypothetical protein
MVAEAEARVTQVHTSRPPLMPYGRSRALQPNGRRIAGVAEARRSLVTSGMARLALSATEIGTEMAVASAIRILGQREAAFPIHEISRTALDLGIKGVTIEAVEARVQVLADKGLIFGTSGRPDRNVTHVTTPEHIAGAPPP